MEEEEEVVTGGGGRGEVVLSVQSYNESGTE